MFFAFASLIPEGWLLSSVFCAYSGPIFIRKNLLQVVKGIACPHSAHCSASPPALVATPLRTGTIGTSGELLPRPWHSQCPHSLPIHHPRQQRHRCFAPAEIIMALGPSTELDVSAAAIPLAWVLAAIVDGWGGTGTSDESVIDVGGMVWRCWRWMWRKRRRWR